MEKDIADIDIGASAFSPLSIREAGIARIQQEIEKAQAAIFAWKTRHNSLTLIARLPPEVLSGIFKFLEMDANSNLTYSSRSLRWIRVTRVCSHWRRVALECPSLWNNIQLEDCIWALEMLERSKMAPLTVSGSVKGPEHTIVLGETLKHLHRIREVSVVMERQCGRPSSSSFLVTTIASLNGAAPLLTSLKIHLIECHEHKSLPADIFSGSQGVSRLRCLDLRNCNMAWQPSLFPCTLTNLSVSGLSPAYCISAPRLISILASLPALTIVHLDSVLLPLSAGDVFSPRGAALPHISHLSLEADLPNCVAFFAGITYPETTIITVRESRSSSDDHDLSSVTFMVGKLITSIIGKAVTQLAVSQGWLQAWTSPDFKRHESPDAAFYLDERASRADGSALWTSVLRSLPARYLKMLGVWFLDLPDSVWVELYGRLNSLERIEVVGTASQIGFLKAFSDGLSSPNLRINGKKPPGRLKFQRLRQLTFKLLDFDDDRGGQRFIDVVKNCLVERRKRGIGLSRLSIEECTNVRDDDDIYLVKHVTWRSDETDSAESTDPEGM